MLNIRKSHSMLNEFISDAYAFVICHLFRNLTRRSIRENHALAILIISFLFISMKDHMWNFMIFTSGTQNLTIKSACLILSNINFFKIVSSTYKLVKSVQFFFFEPFCTLKHGRPQKRPLGMTYRFYILLVALF
jgi:hypothetical protein